MGEDIRPETAVRAAKRWLQEVYADESIERIGLEEVRFRDGNWEITLGFNRAQSSLESLYTTQDLQKPNPLSSALRSIASERRVFKIVVVAGNDNHIIEMRDREVA